MSEIIEPELPSREQCQSLCATFAEVTATDEACAQFFLQDHNWQLQASIAAYYDSLSSDPPLAIQDCTGSQGTPTETDGHLIPVSELPDTITLTLMTWNLDGLDDVNLKKRTKAACKIISEIKPGVVFLQEVIPDTLNYMENRLCDYLFLPGQIGDYFVVTLLRKGCVYFDDQTLTPFAGSRMDRGMLTVKAHIGPVNLLLINSHLESMGESSEERKTQLAHCWKEMLSTPASYTVICGGDLNIRDKEVSALGGLPKGVSDAWVAAGSREECRYTWDSKRNTNKTINSSFKPRMRFDRVYFRHSTPSRLSLRHFGLEGLAKIEGTQSFPSDHWAVVLYFDVTIRQ